MSTAELKEKLIDTIRKTDDAGLLEEMAHLLELQEQDTVYIMNDDQISLVNEAEQQIKDGKYLTNEESDKDTDEWLNK
ncbi:MAG: hypothetical protein SGI96_15565 [Bacteroidota bacterium]|nr:hypothetical protein [Chitinophagaceae bacterium]MDZ4809666.1 hypothetical protein [Bacteroidota bacterium]